MALATNAAGNRERNSEEFNPEYQLSKHCDARANDCNFLKSGVCGKVPPVDPAESTSTVTFSANVRVADHPETIRPTRFD
jgi:hypothetical protein